MIVACPVARDFFLWNRSVWAGWHDLVDWLVGFPRCNVTDRLGKGNIEYP